MTIAVELDVVLDCGAGGGEVDRGNYTLDKTFPWRMLASLNRSDANDRPSWEQSFRG